YLSFVEIWIPAAPARIERPRAGGVAPLLTTPGRSRKEAKKPVFLHISAKRRRTKRRTTMISPALSTHGRRSPRPSNGESWRSRPQRPASREIHRIFHPLHVSRLAFGPRYCRAKMEALRREKGAVVGERRMPFSLRVPFRRSGRRKLPRPSLPG